MAEAGKAQVLGLDELERSQGTQRLFFTGAAAPARRHDKVLYHRGIAPDTSAR